MGKILVLFAHPAIHKSRINRYLLKVYKEFDHLTFRDLYDVYPEFMIDVETEQQLLREHEVIVFHHPFYWYGMPAMLKQWLDLVLESRFLAELRGKKLLNVITTGRNPDAYKTQSETCYSVADMLLPVRQTAYYCRMTFLPALVVSGYEISRDKTRLLDYMSQYRRVLSALSERDPGIHELTDWDQICNRRHLAAGES